MLGKNSPSERRNFPRLNSKARSVLILSVDALIASVSLFLAFWLRFDGNIEPAEWTRFGSSLPLLVAARLMADLYFRLSRWSFRFSGLADGARVAMAGLFGTGLWALGLFLFSIHPGFSRAVVVMELVLSTFLMAAVRFMPRLVFLYRADLLRARNASAKGTVIVGAGAAGEMLLRDLRSTTDHDYHVLGFVDDDPALWGDLVGGKPVLGGISDIPNVAARFHLELVLIAIPNLPAERLRAILSYCSDLQLRFKILPGAYRHLPSALSLLRDLTPADVLERDEVTFSHHEAADFSEDHCQLVAGAAGSIGSEVCEQLLAVGCRRLIMVDINENGLYMQKRRFERVYPDREVHAEVADIRDPARIDSLFRTYRPADIFHAAACKHVPLMEASPGEAIKTNVLGTRVLACAAAEVAARRFVFMSTDKAVRPSSVMGATKRLGEMWVRHMGGRTETRFSVVRFGNVFDSAGSVIPVFREQIKAGGPVTVTHRDARRYFMTISEAVGLVLRAAYGDYGELCVLEMGEPVRILDLARDLISLSGQIPEVDVRIEITGLRPGEKLEEELLDEREVVLRNIDRKVRVVESPPPPELVEELLDAMAAATAREDVETALDLLRDAVGEFQDPRRDEKEVVAREICAGEAAPLETDETPVLGSAPV